MARTMLVVLVAAMLLAASLVPAEAAKTRRGRLRARNRKQKTTAEPTTSTSSTTTATQTEPTTTSSQTTSSSTASTTSTSSASTTSSTAPPVKSKSKTVRTTKAKTVRTTKAKTVRTTKAKTVTTKAKTVTTKAKTTTKKYEPKPTLPPVLMLSPLPSLPRLKTTSFTRIDVSSSVDIESLLHQSNNKGAETLVTQAQVDAYINSATELAAFAEETAAEFQKQIEALEAEVDSTELQAVIDAIRAQQQDVTDKLNTVLAELVVAQDKLDADAATYSAALVTERAAELAIDRAVKRRSEIAEQILNLQEKFRGIATTYNRRLEQGREAKSDRDAALREADSLDNDVQDLLSAAATATARAESFRLERQTVIASIESLELDADQFRLLAEEQHDARITAAAEFARTSAEHDYALAKIELIDQQIELQQSELARWTSTASDYQFNADGFRAQGEVALEVFNTAETAYIQDFAGKALDDDKGSLSFTEQVLRKLKTGDFPTVAEGLQLLNSLVSLYSTEASQAEAGYIAATAQIAAIQHKILALSAQKDGLKKQLIPLGTAKNLAKASLDVVLRAHEAALQQLKETNAEIVQLRARVQQLKADESEQVTIATIANSNVKIATEKAAILRATATSLDHKVLYLHEKAKELAARAQALQVRIDDLQQQVHSTAIEDQAREAFEAAVSARQEAQAAFEKSVKIVAELQSKREKLEGKLDSLAADLREALDDLARHNANNAQLARLIARCQAVVEELIAARDALNQQAAVAAEAQAIVTEFISATADFEAAITAGSDLRFRAEVTQANAGIAFAESFRYELQVQLYDILAGAFGELQEGIQGVLDETNADIVALEAISETARDLFAQFNEESDRVRASFDASNSQAVAHKKRAEAAQLRTNTARNSVLEGEAAIATAQEEVEQRRADLDAFQQGIITTTEAANAFRIEADRLEALAEESLSLKGVNEQKARRLKEDKLSIAERLNKVNQDLAVSEAQLTGQAHLADAAAQASDRAEREAAEATVAAEEIANKAEEIRQTINDAKEANTQALTSKSREDIKKGTASGIDVEAFEALYEQLVSQAREYSLQAETWVAQAADSKEKAAAFVLAIQKLTVVIEGLRQQQAHFTQQLIEATEAYNAAVLEFQGGSSGSGTSSADLQAQADEAEGKVQEQLTLKAAFVSRVEQTQNALDSLEEIIVSTQQNVFISKQEMESAAVEAKSTFALYTTFAARSFAFQVLFQAVQLQAQAQLDMAKAAERLVDTLRLSIDSTERSLKFAEESKNDALRNLQRASQLFEQRRSEAQNGLDTVRGLVEQAASADQAAVAAFERKTAAKAAFASVQQRIEAEVRAAMSVLEGVVDALLAKAQGWFSDEKPVSLIKLEFLDANFKSSSDLKVVKKSKKSNNKKSRKNRKNKKTKKTKAPVRARRAAVIQAEPNRKLDVVADTATTTIGLIAGLACISLLVVGVVTWREMRRPVVVQDC